MSGYGNSYPRDSRSGESGSPGQRRSRSPEGERRGNFQGRREYSGGDRGGRGGYGGDRGGRGGYRGDYGGRGGRGGYDHRPIPSNLPPLPTEVPVPQNGRAFNQPILKLRGEVGNPTKILVNHYEIQSLPTIKVHTYDVSLKVPASSQHRGSDVVTPAQLAKVIVHDALVSLLGHRFIFDGVSLGWSPDLIVPEQTKVVSGVIELPGSRPDRPNEIEVTVKHTGTLNIAAIANAILNKTIPQNPMGDKLLEDNLKFLGNLFRMDPASRFVTRPNANAYFDRSPGTSVPLRSTEGVLEAWRGMFQTVQIRFGRLTINVDTATTAFWSPGVRLLDSCRALTGVSLGHLEQFYQQEGHGFISKSDRLVGIFFCVKHLTKERNARKIKFRGFTPRNARDTTFKLTKDGIEGPETSVQQYYSTKYNIVLQYPNLPLVDSKDGCFPLELCYSAEGERFKEPLQGAETADFIKFATCPATVRAQQITENVQKLHWHELPLPKEFGVSVKTHMLEVDARILRNPRIAYGANSTEEPRSGAWNLRGKRLLQPASINSWALLYFAGEEKKDKRTLDQFASAIARAFGNLGISMPKAEPPITLGNAHGNIPAIVGELLTAAEQTFRAKADLLMVLRHGSDESLYRAIKQACDLQFGVASQVMMAEKAFKDRGQDQYLANVGLKVNVKLGGVNSKLTEELVPSKSWMMIGADTSHPSAGQLRQNPPPPAYGAVVGTYEPSCVRYTGVGVAQLAKEQLITNFSALSKELLKRYKERNEGRLPTNIIYWRDGLGESQFSQILSEEVVPLRAACKELSPTRRINITTVMCIKRHHTRLFPTQGGDRLGNVLPGTVVENDGARNDIFLVAHAGLQGTVRPTRYIVIEDENGLSATNFQRLTNNLCSTYARATRAVSIVPPVYYADQACERAKLHLRTGSTGQSVSGEVHPKHRFNMYWQ